MTLTTLLILAVCWTCVIYELRKGHCLPWSLCGSLVKHRSAESEVTNCRSNRTISRIERSYFVKCSQVGSRTVTAKIIYTVDVQVEPNSSPVTCTCAKVRSLFCVLKVKVKLPFS
ncbi:hypothetical protein pdam_00025815, partial [Pocillopora damicornis]